MKKIHLLLIWFLPLLFQSIHTVSAKNLNLIINKNNGNNIVIKMTEIKSVGFRIDKGTGIGIDDIHKVNMLVKAFQLLQNYPNPFNPSTIIGYVLPEDSPVDVHIFNIKGELVRSFHYTKQNTGNHALTWDAKDETGTVLPAGAYFYQVRLANQVQTKKMLFVK